VVVFAFAVGLVAYTFAGYPALAAALARLRPRPVRADPDFEPDISLVILAYNEEDVIEERLRNCLALDYPPERLELLVAADGSDDATPRLARAHGGARVLHRPERQGKLAAMHHAFEETRGEIVVFSDANNRYSPTALRELAAPFADPQVGAVTGRKAIDDGSGRALDRAEGLYWRYESKLKEWESRIGSVAGVAGEILAFRRAAFPDTPPGTMNDDFAQALLVASAGWRVVYSPRAVSLERASATLEDEAIRRSRLVTGRGQALTRVLPRLARRNPSLAIAVLSHKGLRPLVPWALAAAAVSNLRLARERRWARAALACQTCFYTAAAVGWRQERAGRGTRALYLPYYFCRMNLATVRGLTGFIRGRHEAVWMRVRRG
jgi:cellulose synthase/poly-beta-1,6-N-acetylglucosamine synthase-like glycosyltransferase